MTRRPRFVVVQFGDVPDRDAIMLADRTFVDFAAADATPHPVAVFRRVRDAARVIARWPAEAGMGIVRVGRRWRGAL